MGNNPSFFSVTGGGRDRVKGMDTARFPVENVPWEEAQSFCRKLSQNLRDGRTYRLPTEAEWEFACRAKSATAFAFGNVLNGDLANCNGTEPYGTGVKGRYLIRSTTVGSYPSNPFGLHDMHGNVWEWCSDWFDSGYYANSPQEDPAGAESGARRVTRGGGWRYTAATCRSANRDKVATVDQFGGLGFRVAFHP